MDLAPACRVPVSKPLGLGPLGDTFTLWLHVSHVGRLGPSTFGVSLEAPGSVPRGACLKERKLPGGLVLETNIKLRNAKAVL